MQNIENGQFGGQRRHRHVYTHHTLDSFHQFVASDLTASINLAYIELNQK